MSTISADHSAMVRELKKSGKEICEEAKSTDWESLGNHMIYSVSVIAQLDEVKKQVIYQRYPGNTSKLSDTLTPETADMLHMAIGMLGEAGEVLEAVMAYTLDSSNTKADIVLEMGDLEFYAAGLREAMKVRREQILHGNIAKLRVRYPKGKYSNEAAINRVDKDAQHI